MENLKNLIEKYGSDKAKNNYHPAYYQLFNKISNDVKNVMEIGVGTLIRDYPFSFSHIRQYYQHYTPGGSLRVWRDYFPNSDVYGVDIAEDCKIEEERIKTFIFDSTDIEMVNNHLSDMSFDIIIDDGNHNAIYQLKTIQNLLDRVNDGGYYIIEDVGWGTDKTPIYSVYENELKELCDQYEYCIRGSLLIVRKTKNNKGLVTYQDFLKNT